MSADEAAVELKKPHVRMMDITGKPMKGWLFIESGGYKKDIDLFSWVEKAFVFASSLPKK